jgi:single-strand DNA-binding protein
MSFNRIILVGNLGRDPELRYTPQGTPVCSFTLATNERRKDRAGENQDVTTWFRVTLWGRQAETASQYLAKGRPVYIEGRLRVEEWTDKEGKQRHTLEVHATDMQFIGGRGDETGASNVRSESSASGRSEPSGGDDISDDDIPF